MSNRILSIAKRKKNNNKRLTSKEKKALKKKGTKLKNPTSQVHYFSCYDCDKDITNVIIEYFITFSKSNKNVI